MAIEVQLSERDVVLLVMEYLKSREHITSMVALEEETGHQMEDLGKELAFLRKLVLTGDWDAALSFLTPLQTSAPNDYKRVIFTVKKQQFLEKLESKDARPELPDLVQVLKGIEPLCSGAEFKELCFFLTLSDIREHGDYRAWTAAKGRYAAFQSMLSVLHPLYRAAAPDVRDAGKPEGTSRLMLLLERAVLHQARTVTERNGQSALASVGLDGEGQTHTITLPLLHDVTAHDISADIIVPAGSNRTAGGSGSTERNRAVHSSIDMSKSQRLPDMREMSKSAAREQRNEQAKIEEDSAKSGCGPVSKSPTKSQVKNSGSSSGANSPGKLAISKDTGVEGEQAGRNVAVSWHEEAVGTTLSPPYAAKLVGREGVVEHDNAEERAHFDDAALQAAGHEDVGAEREGGDEQTASLQDRMDGLESEVACTNEEQSEQAACDDEADDAEHVLCSHDDPCATLDGESAREGTDNDNELELEPVRKPVAWTIGFDSEGPELSLAESRARAASSVSSSRSSREMPVLSANRRRPTTAGAPAHDDGGGSGRGVNGLAASRRSGGTGESYGARKHVSTVGKDGDSFGKTVKITHEFEEDGGQASSADSEDDARGRGRAGGGKTVPKALAWVAGMDAAPSQPKAKQTVGRPSLRSSSSGRPQASQNRGSFASANGGGLSSRDEGLRKSRDKEDGGARGLGVGAAANGGRKPISGKVRTQTSSSPRSQAAGAGEKARSPGKILSNGRREMALDEGHTVGEGTSSADGIYDQVYVDDTEPRSPQSSSALGSRSLGFSYSLPGRKDDGYCKSEHVLEGSPHKKKSVDVEVESQKSTSAGAFAPAYPSDRHAASGDRFGGVERVVPLALQAVDVLQDTQVIRTVAWCPDSKSRLLAYGTTSRALRFAEASEERGVRVVYEVAEYHSGSVYAVAWHSRGRLVATGSNDKMVQITRVTQSESGMVSHTAPLVLHGHNGTVRCVSWCERVGATHLVSGGAGDCLLRLWDGESSQCLFSLSGHHDHLQAMCTANDAPLVATGGKDGQVMLWDLRQQHCVTNFASHGDEVLSCALNPSDTMLAAGFSDSSCVMWETRMGKQVKTLSHHQHQCRSVEYTPDGRWLLTASFDGTIAYVDVLDGHVEAVLSGHTDRVVQARAHPTQPWMISCSVDKTVRLWV